MDLHERNRYFYKKWVERECKIVDPLSNQEKIVKNHFTRWQVSNSPPGIFDQKFAVGKFNVWR